MHIQRFSTTGVFIFAIAMILSLFSGIVQAQHPSLMPPVPIPQPNKLIAVPQIRFLDARLIKIGPSHAFEITFESYFWMGLDKDSKPIKYNYPVGSEIVEQTDAQEYTRYSRQLRAYVYIYLDYAKKPIVSQRVDIEKADEIQNVKLALIQANTKILPGLYRISIEIQTNLQSSKNRDYIWADESTLNLQNVVETKRVSPRRAPKTACTSILVISNYENGTYNSLRVGGVNYYSTALKKVQDLPTITENIKELKEKLKEEFKKAGNKDGENYEIKQLVYTIHKREIELMEAQFFKKHQETISKKLEEASKAQEKINKVITEYNKQLRTMCLEITSELRELYLEMWWTGYLCLPKWSPGEKLGTLKELREKWNIARFLEGDLSTEEVQGKWKKDEWVKWMEEEWLPKLEPIKLKFRKFFGDQSLQEDHRWYFGLLENMQETFWFAKNAKAYDEMKKMFMFDYVKLFGQALANCLAYYHTLEGQEPDFPYVNEKYNKPSPGYLTSETYYNKIKSARRNFEKAFAPKQDPSVRPDLSKVKKRKYYVSKDGLYIGPLEYDPITGEKNDGPYDESILNPKNPVGE